MRQSIIGSVALGVLCISLGALGAGPKASEGKAAEMKAQKAEGRADKAHPAAKPARADAKAEKAEAKAEAKAEKAEAKAEKARAKDELRADHAAKDEDEEQGHQGGQHPGLGRGHAHDRSAMRALHAELAHGRLPKAEVKERLAELRANIKERQKEHRHAVAERYGKVVERPAVREELRHHARRSAFLNRALLVAQTELDAKDGAKTVERIEKLIEKENARHERAMQRFETKGEGKARSPEPETSNATNLNAPAKGTEP